MAQHYGFDTCLLDLTNDFKTALFFATCKYDYKTDSYRPLTKKDIEATENSKYGIEEWISQIELTERAYTETDLLSMIIELYLQINNDFKYKEHIHSICQKWIDGQPPIEISNTVSIEIIEVEKLCNKIISYEII